MIGYYLPFVYTLKTRYKNIIGVVSFFIFTCLPSIYFVAMNNEPSWLLLAGYIISFFSMYAIYECGYLFNDILTVQYEDHPTLRVENRYSKIIPKHLENLLTLRLVATAIGCIWLECEFLNIYIYILSIFLLLIVYSIHNFARGYINIFTMLLLVSLKNIIPVIPFLETNKLLSVYIVMLFTIVLLRTWEYASKDRFNFRILKIENIDMFRVKYYLILSFTFLIFFYFRYISMVYVGLPVIFFLYRLASLLLIKNKSVVSKIRNNRK